MPHAGITFMEDYAMSKCEKLLGSLGDYLDRELDASLCAEIEAHMKNCENCRLVVDNLRKTVQVFRSGKPVDMPEGFSKRLHQALKDRWKGTPPA